MRVSESGTPALAGLPSQATLRRRALLVSGMGFFTDAYDLFVIGIVSTLLKTQWHLSIGQLSLLNAVMLGAAFIGALVFGRLADMIGRTRVYWMSAALMVVAAVGSALAPSLTVLIAFRFLLDYAYYGNTISTPQIIALITPHASQTTTIAIQLAIFTVAAVPGYVLAIARMDHFGHRKLQLTGCPASCSPPGCAPPDTASRLASGNSGRSSGCSSFPSCKAPSGCAAPCSSPPG